MKPFFRLALPCLSLALLLPVASARADVIRYRYVPGDDKGNTVLAPIGPGGAVGLRTSYFGGSPQPCPNAKRPTCMVTVVHPCTGRTLIVPLTLPEDTPRMQHRGTTIIYNYGSYAVLIVFLQDGSVEVLYNSGTFRPVW